MMEQEVNGIKIYDVTTYRINKKKEKKDYCVLNITGT